MVTSKEICQVMDKNQKCKTEGIKPKEFKGSMSNWLRKVRIKIGFTNALIKLYVVIKRQKFNSETQALN